MALVATVLALGLAYAPNFYSLSAIWLVDPNYSHGFLVIPIALVHPLATVDGPGIGAVAERHLQAVVGLVFLAAVLALRAFAYEGNSIG